MADWLANNTGMVMTLGLFSSFLIILLWAYLPSNKRDLEEQAMIPFKEQKND